MSLELKDWKILDEILQRYTKCLDGNPPERSGIDWMNVSGLKTKVKKEIEKLGKLEKIGRN